MVGRLAALMKRNQKGFTLVELMVVVLIIAILVAIAIPLYTKSQENAQRSACKANLRTLMGSIAQYMSENETYPAELKNLADEGYIKSVPTCPTDKKAYNYDSETGTVSCPNEDELDHKL